MRRFRIVGVISLILLIVWTGVMPVTAQDGPDYWPTDGWRTSSPEAQDVDGDLLALMLAHIDERDIDIHGLVIVRHGYIIAEAYYEPYSETMQHTLASIAKSLTSILIGMAMHQGAITSVDQRLVDFFPDRTIANLDARKQAITLEHLLTMTAGFDCRDAGNRTVEQMIRRPDWVQFMLDLPMSRDPGTDFNYCNGVSHLLSAIVHETTGMTALELAREQLFPTLGIGRVTWERDPDGNPAGGWGLYMTPRDMARLGILYLNDGAWDGEQLVPADYVAASTRRHSSDATMGYGYQWWVSSAVDFRAIGAGGQYIIVRPDYDLVVVFTSDPQRNNYEELTGLFTGYILPAVRHGAPEGDDS